MKPVILMKVTSDGYKDQLMTVSAYQELTLEMDTKDFITHDHEIVIMPDTLINWHNVVELTDLPWCKYAD